MPVLDKPPRKPTIWTAEDLLTLPADRRVELVQGELIEMPPPPGGPHGNATMRLSAFVSAFVLQHGLGDVFSAETGFLIEQAPDTVLAPDFAFVREERMPATLQRGYLALAPDVVLETQSPSDTESGIRYKAQRWLHAGARSVWVMDPERASLTVYRPNTAPEFLNRQDTLSAEDVLPGFTLPLEAVFARIAPVTSEEPER
ncbi:MAG TPA: Uma2 family endonuclease [Armatimonadota bacterium]